MPVSLYLASPMLDVCVCFPRFHDASVTVPGIGPMLPYVYFCPPCLFHTMPVLLYLVSGQCYLTFILPFLPLPYDASVTVPGIGIWKCHFRWFIFTACCTSSSVSPTAPANTGRIIMQRLFRLFRFIRQHVVSLYNRAPRPVGPTSAGHSRADPSHKGSATPTSGPTATTDTTS